jgi:pilus assembly protein CpaE
MTGRFSDISEAERFDDDDFGAGFDADDDFSLGAKTGGAKPPAAAFPADDGLDMPAYAPPQPTSNPVAALQASAEAAFGETSVPRIAIHAFCQRPETADAVDKAAGDRRLARATTLVHDGGLDEALARYQNEPTPSLIMVESNAPAAELLAGLDRLAEVCDPGTKVVVIGGHNDIGLYRELMRRGVSEYLVPPLQPLQLIRTITGLYADPATPFIGRTLAFVGAKGGVGASTIAHNVGFSLAEVLQSNTVIVDFDLAFGTAGLDFNQDPIQGMADALAKPDRLDPVLLDRMIARCTDRLSLFAAPASLDDDYEFSAEAYEDVANKIRATAPFVVYDLPHTWSGWMRRTLMAADEVVIVAAPDLASLRNAKNMIDLLGRARPNDAPPRLILNQIGLPGRPEIPVKDFAKALGLEPALCLPFDAKLFGQAANNGQMIHEVNPKAKASEGLSQFVQGLARRDAPVVKPKSLVDRLLKRG